MTVKNYNSSNLSAVKFTDMAGTYSVRFTLRCKGFTCNIKKNKRISINNLKRVRGTTIVDAYSEIIKRELPALFEMYLNDTKCKVCKERDKAVENYCVNCYDIHCSL